MKKQLKGIAWILFGILLCAADAPLNRTVFASMSDMPLALLGVAAGIVGLVIACAGSSEA